MAEGPIRLGPLTVFVLWLWMFDAGSTDEVDIFNSDKQETLTWTSEPQSAWTVIHLRTDEQRRVPVLQACKKRVRRTVLSGWMERGEARLLNMDLALAQEEEPSGLTEPIRVHLLDTDSPIRRYRDGDVSLDLRSTRLLPADHTLSQIRGYLNHTRTLSLGPVSSRGFHVAFSFSGTCALLTSIRVFYRRCPESVAQLAVFGAAGAGSGPEAGSCVTGALEVSPPVRECEPHGEWGPVRGGCTCRPGHQIMEHTCQACRMNFYKPANHSAGCRQCPANSKTHAEGSESCDCLQEFSRLPTDPIDLGCTKPPSAPINLTAHHQNHSALILAWDPPLDLGGRQEVTYGVECRQEAERGGGAWESCDPVVYSPGSSGLSSTSVAIVGLDPHRSYRLSVQACNDICSLQGALHTSTATVTIQRWKAPPAVITVSPPQPDSVEPDLTAAPQHSQGLRPSWLIMVVAVIGGLLLITVAFTSAMYLCPNSSKRRPEQDMELLPTNAQFTYRCPPTVEPASESENREEDGGVAYMWAGLSRSMLDSLKDVLVDRHKLSLGKELGKGEFGSVCEGTFTPEEGSEVKVAVKTMRVGFNNQEDLHNFLREAVIMKNFDHEHVVRLLGVALKREQDSPLPFPLVILPFMKHGDLRRFLIATRYGDIPMFLPYQTLLRFMVDIAAGMSYLSCHGFLHRDLAARNCMLGDDLRVCVADFGMSKQIYGGDYYRQRDAIRVPIKWMATESLSESVYTTKSDVWSFGVTMWEIVSRGRSPYPGVQNHELLDFLQSGHRLKAPEECDDKLYEVMWSCWEQEPSHRPGFGELGERLKALLSELPLLEPMSLEASYINQGLGQHTGKWDNIQLPAPMGAAAAAAAAAAREEDESTGNEYVEDMSVTKVYRGHKE